MLMESTSPHGDVPEPVKEFRMVVNGALATAQSSIGVEVLEPQLEQALVILQKTAR